MLKQKKQHLKSWNAYCPARSIDGFSYIFQALEIELVLASNVVILMIQNA